MVNSTIVYDADVVVVGSGVAGALLAGKLASAGFAVSILEAGDAWQRDEALARYQASWKRTLNAPFKHATWAPTSADAAYFGGQGNTRYQPAFLKGVGGTSWQWTGITPRFLPADFELNSRYGVGADWPISYDDLEPYYVQAEHALGVSGDSTDHHGSPRSKPYPMPAIPMTYADQVIAEKLMATGVRIASLPAARNSRAYDGRPACRGNNSCTPLCPIGASYSADVDVKKATAVGARLIKRAVVYRFDIDRNKRIVRAFYKHPDGSSHSITARRFVLACNSIETARLLLMSANRDCPDGVANSSGQVGRNLMDHAIFVSKFRMPEPLYLGRGPQSVSTILAGRDGAFRSEYAAAKFFLGNDLNIHQEAAGMLRDESSWIEPLKNLKNIAIHQGQIGAEVEQLPDKKNRLQLDQKRLDPLGLPLPYINYQLSDYTKKGIEVWKNYTENLIDQLGATEVDTSLSLSSHHPGGTTRMGRDVKASVVNEQCRSHDHDNLYIIGGSLFPAMGTANPTLTIAALSLRLADHIMKSEKTT